MSPLNDDEATALLNGAYDCSVSDTCSLQDAQWYLNQIVGIESGCVVGSLTDPVICDHNDQDDSLEQVVTALRNKVASSGGKGMANMPSQQIMASTAVAIASIMVVATTNWGGDETIAFVPQEWFWAARDGYFLTMLDHFLANGGLTI